MSHSLRPHTMEGHMLIYKNCIHHRHNTLGKHNLEALGAYVSMLNECTYCVEHHYSGMKRLIGDDARSEAIRSSFETGNLDLAWSKEEQSLFDYAKKLTLTPGKVNE